MLPPLSTLVGWYILIALTWLGVGASVSLELQSYRVAKWSLAAPIWPVMVLLALVRGVRSIILASHSSSHPASRDR